MSSILSYMIFGFAVCSIFLGYNYYNKNPKNQKNKRFLLFCISSTVWSLGFGFLIIQESTDKAWLCRSLGMIGVFPYIYFGLTLLGYLADSSNTEKKWLKYTGLFGFFIYPFIIDPKVQSFELTSYGMAYSFINNFWVTLYNIYFALVVVLIIFIIIKFKKRTNLKRKRVTFRTIVLFVIMLVIGATLDTILPSLGFVSFPGSTITQFFGVCLIYSALNYEMKNSTSIVNIAQYIFHLSNFPIIVFNSKNKLSLISDSACEFLGISKNDTNVIIEDIFDSDGNILDESNTGKEYKCSLNNSICELSIQKVVDNYGDIVGHVVIIYDLTEKNKMISELENAKIEAENASKAKENFLANISHEIRTPLNVVLGMNEMLYNETDMKLIKDYSKNIDDAGKNLLNTINDVLDFSKIQSGKLDITNGDYNLKETIQSTTNLLRTKIEGKGLQLNVEINNDIPDLLNGDKMRIEQILLNLMDNSVKYTSAGKIKVIADFESIDKDNVNIIISVRDTGCGINDEDKNSLFTSFKRLEEDKNRMFEGTGLGLAITKKLVDAMNGSISVESDVGVGSCFKVTIPHKVINSKKDVIESKDVKEEEIKEIPKTNDELNIPNVNVLAVDDNSTNLLVFKGLLKKTNAKIDTTTKGSEALELFKSKHYDIVFLDHMMPEMDGIEVLNRIKDIEKDKEPGTPIIVLTANAMEGSKEEYLEYGFNDYLSKPVNGASLKDMLKKFLIDKPDNELTKEKKKNTKEEVNDEVETANSNESISEDKINEPTEEKEFIDEKNTKEEVNDEVEATNSNESISEDKINEPTEEKEFIDEKNTKEEVNDEVEATNSNESISEDKINEPTEEKEFIDEKNTKEEVNNEAEATNSNESISESDTNEPTEEKEFIDEKTTNTDREFIEDRKINANGDLVACFEKITKYKNNNFIDLDGYINELENLKKLSKDKGFTKLAQRAYVHLLKSKDKDIDYLKNNFVDLENEYNKIK